MTLRSAPALTLAVLSLTVAMFTPLVATSALAQPAGTPPSESTSSSPVSQSSSSSSTAPPTTPPTTATPPAPTPTPSSTTSPTPTRTPRPSDSPSESAAPRPSQQNPDRSSQQNDTPDSGNGDSEDNSRGVTRSWSEDRGGSDADSNYSDPVPHPPGGSDNDDAIQPGTASASPGSANGGDRDTSAEQAGSLTSGVSWMIAVLVSIAALAVGGIAVYFGRRRSRRSQL